MTTTCKLDELEIKVPMYIYSQDENLLIIAVAKILEDVVDQFIPVIDDDYECMSTSFKATIEAVEKIRFKDTHEQVVDLVSKAYLRNQSKYANDVIIMNEVQA